MKTSFYINNVDYTKYVIDIPTSTRAFEDGYLIGNTPSTNLTLKLDNSSEVFNTLLDNQFIMKQGTKQIGVFNVVEKPQKMTKELALTLNDNMIKANIRYQSELAYPCTIQDQLLDMKKILGIDIDYSGIPIAILSRVINFYDNTLSIRNHLSWISELCACNVIATSMGVLKFVLINKNVSKTMSGKIVEKFDCDEVFNVTKVRFDNGLLLLEKGVTTGNTIYINPNNPYIELQSDIDYIYTQMNGLTFNSIHGFKTMSINDLCLGEIVEWAGKFKFIALNIREDYLNATYDIQEISGNLVPKISENVINRISNDTKIRGVKVRTDQNEAKLEIVATEQVDINKKVGTLTIGYEQVKSSVEQIDGTVYKFETGSNNIFDNCNQSVSKDSKSTTEVISVSMPFGINTSFIRNKDICISVEINATKAIPKTLSGYMGAEFTITYIDNTTQVINTMFVPGTFLLEYFDENGYIDMQRRIFTHYKVQDKEIKSVSNLKIIISCNGQQLRVANPKVEMGTYPTGYEFDVPYIRDNVTTLDKQFTALDQKVGYIALQSTSLTQEVSTIKGNVTTLETRMQSTELKLTPTNITAMVNEKIGADGSIKTTKVTIDKTGLSVYGGGISIYNNANQKVFYADNDGNLTLSAHITYAQIDGANINISQDARVGNILYLGNSSDINKYRYISLNGSEIIPNTDLRGNMIVYANNRVSMTALDYVSINAGPGVGGGGVDVDMSTGFAVINLSANQIKFNGTIIHSSDIRKKNSIQEFDENWIDDLHVFEFKYNGNQDRQIGLIAQEYINKPYSDYFLNVGKDGYYGIAYGNITNALIKYAQVSRKEIRDLAMEVAKLKGGK